MKEFTKLIETFEEASEKIGNTKHIIQVNRVNYPLIQSQMDSMYQYVKGIAPEFYDEETGRIDDLYKTLTDDVLCTEAWVSEYAFIVPDKPIFNYSFSQEIASNASNEEILDYIIHTVWQKYADKYIHAKIKRLDYESFATKCSELCDMVLKLCEKHGIECHIVRINPGFIDSARLYNGFKIHDLCIIKLKTEYYIVDPSYRQFFMLRAASLDRIGIPYLGTVFPGIFMKMSTNRYNVASRLIQRGWTNFDDENIKPYFDGFALSFRNGLYYDITGDYSYTTDYNTNDYLRFLLKEDSQVNHEGEEVLRRQKTIYKKM